MNSGPLKRFEATFLTPRSSAASGGSFGLSKIALVGISVATVIYADATAATPVDARTEFSDRIGASDAALAQGKAMLISNPGAALSKAEFAQQQLLKLPTSSARVKSLAQSAWLRGAANISLNRPAQAEADIMSGLNGGIAKVAPQSKVVADLHMARATALPLLGDIAGALKELQTAYAIYRAIGDTRGQALALQNIGISFYYARDYARAKHYYDLSLEQAKNDPSIRLTTLANRGQALAGENKFEAAASEFARGIMLAHAMGASLVERRLVAMLADAQLRGGNGSAASKTIAQGFDMASKDVSEEWQPELYCVAANLALQLGQIEKATNLIEKALAMKTSSSTLVREEQRIAYDVYKARGEEGRALKHLEQFKKLDDDARNVAASNSAALMAAQFDYANQNLKIVELQRGEATRDAVIARNRQQMLMALLAATGAIILLLLFMQISLRRSRNRVAAANEDLSVANADLEKALAARTEFLATTSHEIRTPLNGVLGMTQVLLADRALEPQLRAKIELVHGAGETMRALVDDLLDLAKMTTGEIAIHKAPMNLPKLLRETVQVWEARAQAQGLAITLDLRDLPEMISEDEIRLRQIVFNLLSNAIKFTDQGAVCVTASVQLGEAGEHLLIEIVDTGIGIPADRLEEIFESFRQVDSGKTRRHSGTGLGLAICRSLAKAMGGTVTVASVFGAGATFTIDLPLMRIAEAPTPVPRVGGPMTLAEARVLLVEGNLLTQSILRALITPQALAFTGVATIADAKAALAAGDTDLLLIDSGVIALEVANAADLVTLAGRTVLLWPQPEDRIRAQAAEIGVAEILSTPLTPPELVAKLRALYAEMERSEDMAA